MNDMGDQLSLSKSLNKLLSEINSKMNIYTAAARDQATLAGQVAESFRQSSQEYKKITTSAQSISQNVTQFSSHMENSLKNNKVIEYFDEYSSQMENITDKYDNTSKASRDLTTAATEANKAANENASALDKAFSADKKALDSLYKSNKSNLNSLSKVSDSLGELTNSHNEFVEKAEEAAAGANKFAAAIKSTLSVGMGVLKVIGSIVGLMANFFKTALTLPFMVLDKIATLGNALRQDVAVTIEQAAQDSKDFFDQFSNIGQGIRKMTGMGKGMLKTFESYNSQAVKLFGEGASGISNMIKQTTESIKNMGSYSELFGQTITRNKDALFHYTRLKKIMGLTADQEAYYAQDAGVNLISVNDRMTVVALKLDETGKEFDVDSKRLSLNFNKLRTDIALYSHLSDEELMKSTARLTQMKVSVEDASNVFKKFNTFEDAANSVAMLSQTFGMNLDAMDIIQANNPEDIINMFRDGMIATGRTFDELNRFEKGILADQTGMTQEGLKALMTLRDKGLTHSEAVDAMKDQTPEAQQLKAIKELSSSMKMLQKIMNFNSPFEAFLKGLGKNAAATGKARKSFMSLSNTYQMIHDFALNLDGDTVNALAEPVILIVNVMKDIFNSPAFKGGLVSLVQGFGELATFAFGITDSDKIYYEVQDSLSKLSKNQNLKLSANIKTNIETDTDLSEATKALWKKHSSKKGSTRNKFAKFLKEFKQKAADDPTIAAEFDKMMKKFGGTYDFTALNRKIQDSRSGNKAASKLKERVQKTINSSQSNFKAFFDISGQTMGAMLKGAAVLLTSGINVINYALDQVKAEDIMGKSGGKTLLERFFDWDAGEFEQIGKVLEEALASLFTRTGKLFFFGTWLLEQFAQLTLQIGGMFFDALMSAGRKIAPSFFDKNLSAREIAYNERDKGGKAFTGVKDQRLDNINMGSNKGKTSALKKMKDIYDGQGPKGYKAEVLSGAMTDIQGNVNADILSRADYGKLFAIEKMLEHGQGAKSGEAGVKAAFKGDKFEEMKSKLQNAIFKVIESGIDTNVFIKALKEKLKYEKIKSSPKRRQLDHYIDKSITALNEFKNNNVSVIKKDETFMKLLGKNFNLLQSSDPDELIKSLKTEGSLFGNDKFSEALGGVSGITAYTMRNIPGASEPLGELASRATSWSGLKAVGDYEQEMYDKKAIEKGIIDVKDGFFSDMFAVKPGGAVENVMTLLSSATVGAGEAISNISSMFSGTNIQTENKKYTAEDLMKLKEGIKKMKEEMNSDKNVNASLKITASDLEKFAIELIKNGNLRSGLSRHDIVSRDTLYFSGESTNSSSGQDGRPSVFASDPYPEGELNA
jgi:hypothetical protein